MNNEFSSNMNHISGLIAQTNLLSENPGYYRSRIITTNVGVNPLIAAAVPLFLIAEKIHTNNFEANRNRFLQDLSHEIKAFENKAYVSEIATSTIQTARYALCTFIDEIILQTAWGKTNTWKNETLLDAFHKETDGNNQFFVIIERALQQPKENLDLLEMLYLILSFGYEGQYRSQENKHLTLTSLADKLYGTLKQYRPETDKHLLIQADTKLAAEKPKINWKKLALRALAMVILINLGVYLTFALKLNATTKSLTSMIKQHSDAIQNLGERA